MDMSTNIPAQNQVPAGMCARCKKITDEEIVRYHITLPKGETIVRHCCISCLERLDTAVYRALLPLGIWEDSMGDDKLIEPVKMFIARLDEKTQHKNLIVATYPPTSYNEEELVAWSVGHAKGQMKVAGDIRTIINDFLNEIEPICPDMLNWGEQK